MVDEFAFGHIEGERTHLKRDHIVIQSDEDWATFCFRLGRLKYTSNCCIRATKPASQDRFVVCHSA